tara:strand:- start:186 stop:1013 length:828 start_codon:yes stop_codon:yes gene_type:complete
MPAVHHGFEISEIYPQPGFTVTVDDNGVYTGTGFYLIRKEAAINPAINEKLRIGTSLTDLDNDPYKAMYSFLTISKTPRTYEEGDQIRIAVEFTGSNVAQYGEGEEISEEAQPRYTLDLQSWELPLSQNPKWVALGSTVKTVLGYLLSGVYLYDIGAGEVVIPQEDGSRIVDSTLSALLTGDAAAFAALIAVGETTFKSPSISWTETTTGTEALTTAQLNSIAKISTPRGNPPEPAGRNWMLDGGTQDQVGTTYQTRLTWVLSGRTPHSTFLYED